MTQYGSEGRSIDFRAYLSVNETVQGVMVTKVRPSFRYTNVYMTNVKTTYFNSLNATKEFEYISWNAPIIEVEPEVDADEEEAEDIPVSTVEENIESERESESGSDLF